MFKVGDEIPGLDRSYRVRAIAGSGSSGTTYRVLDSKSGEEAIVKAIELRGLSEWKVLELFEREAATLRRIDHPRIPRYLASFILDDGRVVSRAEEVRGRPIFMLVQQYIAGDSLATRLRGSGALSSAAVTRLLDSLLSLAQYLHALSPPIVHRDIKPGNIILDETDEPHLVDFGSVRDCLRSDGSVGSTTAGTFGYMPAEQMMNTARPASDLYAIAMTVVVAATGTEPNGLPMNERTGKIRLERLQLPGAIVPALDGMLEPIVGNRLQTVADVRAVLQRRGVVRPRPRVIALGAALGYAGFLALRLFAQNEERSTDVTDLGGFAPMTTVAPPPVDWFSRVRPHCNAIEAEVTLRADPAPPTTAGQADAAACFALAGKIALAKRTLDALAADERAAATNQVFNIVHPIADQGDDAATGPIMRLVLDYTPDNFMALYHAGMAEYQNGEVEVAKKHLLRFLDLYRAGDGWVQSAERVLKEIAKPSHKNCDAPLLVDPEGHAVHPPGCE
jgi:Protein kinase domain